MAYCVDGIMSFYQNNTDKTTPVPFTADGLVLSFNTASTSVIPILKGKGILSHAKRFNSTNATWTFLTFHDRIPWGGSQASDYLLKLVQLKYPNFPTRVTPQQSTAREFLSYTYKLLIWRNSGCSTLFATFPQTTKRSCARLKTPYIYERLKKSSNFLSLCPWPKIKQRKN